MEDVYVGNYRLIARLGQGGTADVFLAYGGGPHGSRFTKLAVIKRLRPHLAEDPEFVSMLMDEGRLTAQLSHPNIVQVAEIGRDGNDYFLAMEHLDGQPLHVIERRAAKLGIQLAPELLYGVIVDVLAGLHSAHEMKDLHGHPLEIVHRDVTPHNIFVTYDGVVKVCDFGIAKAMGRLTETRHGMVKGKIRYMSPEQAAGGKLDRRTDIFAAGVLLFKAATGRRLWGDLEEHEVPNALVTGAYNNSPRAIEPKVPAAIDAICRKALAFDPSHRYATAAEMQSDLEAVIARQSGHPHREIAKHLQTMFAKEREKLRALLKRSAAPARGPREKNAGVAASRPSPSPSPKESPRESTKQMTIVLAPTRPSASIRPVVTTNHAPGLGAPPTRAATPQAPLPLRSSLAIALLCVAAVVTFAAALVTSSAAHSPSARRAPNVLAGERQPLVTLSPSEVRRSRGGYRPVRPGSP